MKIFVTGASGFVGEAILQQLHADGYGIRVLSRQPQSSQTSEQVTRYNVEIHAGDVSDAASLAGGLVDIQAVIHLVGIIGEAGKNTFENVHVRGTQNIVNAARQAGVKRFIHMSALGTRPNAVARYHQSKWAAEACVRNSGLDYTIFRPSIIYGPRDHFVNLFANIARFSPVLPVMGRGDSKLQPVPVEDVATCFVKAIIESRAIGQTYDLCGLDRLSFNALIDSIASVMGRTRWKLHVPMSIARLQAALLEFIFPRLLGKPSPLTRDQLLMLQEDNVGNPQPADDLFNLEPISFAERISRYLKN